MTKRFFVVILFLISTLNTFTQNVYEGFWLPQFIKDYNYKDMTKLGLQLPCDSLYNTQAPSLFNGVVQFSHNLGSGAMISNQGLLLTSYQTGYHYISHHSTSANNFITNGFWAKNFEEEIPCKGLFVRFFIRMEDVTSIIYNNIPKAIAPEFQAIWIDNTIQELKTVYSENGKYVVDVKPFYRGNNYYLFVYEEFKDVRLVGGPPFSIGKFGGETDNWVWPRHSGNFSLFRVYSDSLGRPAEFAKENLPFTPKYFYPIETKGVALDDFTMILGFPIKSNRFMTSYEISNLLNKTNPAFLEACDAILPVIQNAIYANETVRLKYSDWFSGLANNWKQKKGESYSLQRFNAINRRENREVRVRNWMSRDSTRLETYRTVFEEIESICKELDPISEKYFWYANISFLGSKMLYLPIKLIGLRPENKQPFTSENRDVLIANYKTLLQNIDFETEAKIIQASYRLWQKIPVTQRPNLDPYIAKYFNGDVNLFLRAMTHSSIFSSEKHFKRYLKRASVTRFERDPLIRYFYLCMEYLAKGEQNRNYVEKKIDVPHKKYLEALREMRFEIEHPMYPNANGSPRVSFGKVSTYSPSDGVNYNYFTTTEGIVQKEIPGHPEFSFPAKLKELINAHEYGNYAENEQLHVCFITNNDITGGNSGSPVLNNKGQLLGCVFDGNWEALTNNIIYNSEKQRAIIVDIRYILFIIDKVAGAQNILEELKVEN